MRQLETRFRIFDPIETTSTTNKVNQMKTPVHPWMTTSACNILNPPKKFGFKDVKFITKKIVKAVVILVGFVAICAGLYGLLWLAMAW